MNMVNTEHNSTEDLIHRLQQLKGKTKLNLFKKIRICFDKMSIRMDEDPFAKNAQGISEIYHEVLLLMKFLQSKPQIKTMNINYYDLYYTVIENRDEKGLVDNKYENEYISLNDVIIQNHYVGIKGRKI